MAALARLYSHFSFFNCPPLLAYGGSLATHIRTVKEKLVAKVIVTLMLVGSNLGAILKLTSAAKALFA